MAINRSEFLRLSAWGFVATLLPIHEIKALSFISDLKTYSRDNHAEAVKKAADAKVHFFKKEYSKAESLYLECIRLAPADIRFYDNLQNVYCAQGIWLKSVELFKNGLDANPNKVSFYDRAARSLMRLELGYPVLAADYRKETNSRSLLEDAKSLYEQGLKIDSKAKYLNVGKEKVIMKIETDALNINYRTDPEEKKKRMERRRNHKKRYKEFSNEQLLERLKRIDERKRNTLYFDNEKSTREKNIVKEKGLINMLLAERYYKERSYEKALSYADLVYKENKNNTKGVKLIKLLYERMKRYSELVSFQHEYHEQSQTVYSALGLMYCLKLQYVNDERNNILLKEAINIGEDLIYKWGLTDTLLVCVIDKLADLHILNNNVTAARDLLKKAIESVSTNSDGVINNLIHDYAKTYFEDEKYEAARDIILLGLRDFQAVTASDFKYVNALVDRKTVHSFNSNLRLYHLLYKVYDGLGDIANSNYVLQFVLLEDPENKFALKRL